MLHHLTVTVVDWALAPFNYFAASVIDWRRGGRLYVLICVSTVLAVATHVYWKRNGIDAGHMITKAGVVLPAGWAHLVFSILEMTILTAFVFCRRTDASRAKVATIFALIYFLGMGICGYIMHGHLILSDAITFVSGLFFVLVYPMIGRRRTTF